MQTKLQSINLDKITPEISEIAGLFAADGSMQKEHICFWGNPYADKEFYDTHLKSLFLKAFNISINPHHKKSNSVYGFYVCKKRILNFFNKRLEFPIGKKTYTVKVPTVIFKSKDQKIISAFIRGFFAGDGCLNFDKRYGQGYQRILTMIHTYPRIQLKSVSKFIIYQISDMLYKLNIIHFTRGQVSKKENEVTSYIIEIRGRPRLKRWTKEIGFSNQNHSSRYGIFKNFGFVPSNTTYNQRIDILERRLDPWSFYPKWIRSLAWIGRQKED